MLPPMTAYGKRVPRDRGDRDRAAVRQSHEHDRLRRAARQKIVDHRRDVVMLVQIEAEHAAAFAVTAKIADCGAVAGGGEAIGEANHRNVPAVPPETGKNQNQRSRRRVVKVVADLGPIEGGDGQRNRLPEPLQMGSPA